MIIRILPDGTDLEFEGTKPLRVGDQVVLMGIAVVTKADEEAAIAHAIGRSIIVIPILEAIERLINDET